MGDPAVVESAFKAAKSIDGIESLEITKSKAVLEVYGNGEAFTNNALILDVLNNKTIKVIEKDENGHHSIRRIIPMIAEQRCLSCHYNSAQGDVLGAMDLTISLDKIDEDIATTEMILFIALLIALLIFAALSSIFFTKEVFQPLCNLQERTSELVSGDKDLTKRLKYKKGNEFGNAAQEINNFIEMVQGTINDVKELGKQNAKIAQEVLLSSDVIVQSTKKEGELVQKTAQDRKSVV